MLARVRLMPCAAMQAPVCQLPPYRCHALGQIGLAVNDGLDLAHGRGSEPMFDPSTNSSWSDTMTTSVCKRCSVVAWWDCD